MRSQETIKHNTNEQPDGIILTISKKMYGANGYRHWLRNFLHAMTNHENQIYYWLRVSSKPTMDNRLLFVYLCVGNKIRYRGYYGGVRETPEGYKEFDDGRQVSGRFWILISGPVERSPRCISKQGFQGFRYTQKLW